MNMESEQTPYQCGVCSQWHNKTELKSLIEIKSKKKKKSRSRQRSAFRKKILPRLRRVNETNATLSFAYLDIDSVVRHLPSIKNEFQHKYHLVRVLDLSNTKMKSIPSGFVRLFPEIKTLDLSNNQLQTPKKFLWSLPNLKTLVLNNNPLIDEPISPKLGIKIMYDTFQKPKHDRVSSDDILVFENDDMVVVIPAQWTLSNRSSKTHLIYEMEENTGSFRTLCGHRLSPLVQTTTVSHKLTCERCIGTYERGRNKWRLELGNNQIG